MSNEPVNDDTVNNDPPSQSGPASPPVPEVSQPSASAMPQEADPALVSYVAEGFDPSNRQDNDLPDLSSYNQFSDKSQDGVILAREEPKEDLE